MIALGKLLALLPPGLLDHLAAEHKADARNQVRLPGGTVFVCLLDGLLNHGDLTLRLLEDIFQRRIGRTRDHSSFGKRRAAVNADYFTAIYTHLYQQLAPQAMSGEARALCLRWVDATLVTLSAKLLAFGITMATRRGKADHRSVKSILNLRQEELPYLLHVCKEQAEASDDVALGQAMREHSLPGDLWVLDRGTWGRERLRQIAEVGYSS